MSHNVGPVPVLGMHRSGTSVVTRLLGLAGAALPLAASPGRTSNEANRKGFWEVQPLTDLNGDVLRALDGDWSAPPPLPEGWPADPRLTHLHRRAQALARRHLSEPGVVWKDPRLCLTLPFWADVIGADAPVVLALRNPLETVASLTARDRLDPALGFALWERYLRSALAVATGRPALVLTYEEAIAQPSDVVGRVREWFEAVGVPLHDASAPDAISEFVAANLRHSRHDDADIERDDVMTEEQKALHRAVTALTGTHERLAPPELPEASNGDELIEARRAARASARRARDRWDRRLRRAVLGRGSELSRRRRRPT